MLIYTDVTLALFELKFSYLLEKLETSNFVIQRPFMNPISRQNLGGTRKMDQCLKKGSQMSSLYTYVRTDLDAPLFYNKI